MDVSSFLGGNFLTQLDLPAASQVWTIREVAQQQVGDDTKICIRFDQHTKPLGCNKTNLRTIAEAYGTDAAAWIGRPLELYRDQTQFQGQIVPCIRARIPQQAAAAPAPAAVPQPVVQPVAAPAPQQFAQPVAPQQQAPWEAAAAANGNNPPSA